MATLKLKKSPDAPVHGPDRPNGPWRPPVRGKSGATHPRPTLAQAQAERAQRAESQAQADTHAHADRGPRQRPDGPRDHAPRGGPRTESRPDQRADHRMDPRRDPRQDTRQPPRQSDESRYPARRDDERGFRPRQPDAPTERPAWNQRPQRPGGDARRPQAVNERPYGDRPAYPRADRSESRGAYGTPAQRDGQPPRDGPPYRGDRSGPQRGFDP
ncbi:MAG: hypothetical protein AB9M53_07400, partial [Leptothrix sp. (in: b-proteobacteria)]